MRIDNKYDIRMLILKKNWKGCDYIKNAVHVLYNK